MTEKERELQKKERREMIERSDNKRYRMIYMKKFWNI